jgi:hypothetical protein
MFMVDLVSIGIGFVFGIVASGISALVYEYGTRPLLQVLLDDSPRAQGQKQGKAPHEFYHLKVRNVPPRWPLPGRKPAWACKASNVVFDLNGKRVIPDPIIARWPSQPEPLLPAVNAGQVTNLLDPTRLVAAQSIDVHTHEDQQLNVAIKYEGSQDCHIFSNESYLYPMWQNPAWRLGNGTYKLKITLYYERGAREFDFNLLNTGSTRDDLSIELWQP